MKIKRIDSNCFYNEDTIYKLQVFDSERRRNYYAFPYYYYCFPEKVVYEINLWFIKIGKKELPREEGLFTDQCIDRSSFYLVYSPTMLNQEVDENDTTNGRRYFIPKEYIKDGKPENYAPVYIRPRMEISYGVNKIRTVYFSTYQQAVEGMEKLAEELNSK